MQSPIFLRLGVLGAFGLACAATNERARPAEPEPDVDVEASIESLRAGMAQGALTARGLSERALARIDRFDGDEGGLNALLAASPTALDHATELDRVFAATGELGGSLHGVTVIVKDNIDTGDQPTTAGLLALEKQSPGRDAFAVARIRAAGGVVIGKANLMEIGAGAARSRSSLGGDTRNAYDTARSPLGSSGGTAVAVAASFATVGLGTDTNGSILAPAAAAGLVGVRPTLGLVSRHGVVAGLDATTVAGPMARSAADAALLLEVIAAEDPSDPSTAGADARVPPAGYRAALDEAELDGARLGVVPALIERGELFGDATSTEPEVLRLAERTLADLSGAGATLVSTPIADIDAAVFPKLAAALDGAELRFKFDLDRYLEQLGPNAVMHSLDEIVASGRMLPELRDLAAYAASMTVPPEQSSVQLQADEGRVELRDRLVARMDELDVRALVYLTLQRPAQPFETTDETDYGPSPALSAYSGLPAITFPIGFVEGQPAGMTLLGRPYDEATLLALVHAYERDYPGRRAPPDLAAGRAE